MIGNYGKVDYMQLFQDIISGDLGGYLDKRTTPEAIKQEACLEI
jgi:hypothetical protein